MANYNNSKTSSKSQSPTYNSGKNISSVKDKNITNDTKNVKGPTPASDAFQSVSLPPTFTGTEISLRREAFNRKQFDDTIDTSFSQLGIPVEADRSTFDPSLATVGDFFTIYQSLFYQIPKEGPNSHEFLIVESTEYLQYVAQQEEIDELLEEINLLREQNLELVGDINTVTLQLTDALADNATNG